MIAGRDWGQKKRASENEMARRHHWCDEHELGQILGDVEGQGVLACCSPWGCKESDTTGWLNNSDKENTWLTSQRILVPSEFIAGPRIWDHFSEMCVVLLHLCKQHSLVWLHNHENYGSLLSTLSVTVLTLLLCLVPGWEKVTSGIYCSRSSHVLLGCQLTFRRPAHVPTCRALPSDFLV